MHKKIKKKIQHQLDKIKLSNEPRQIILSIARYSRREKSKRWWLELKCQEHGKYLFPNRLDEVIKNNGNKCSKCGHIRGGKKLSIYMAEKNGSLAKLYPHIAAEWHPTLNIISPDKVATKSNMNPYWRCKLGHIFRGRVADRVDKKTSCSTCSKHLRVSKFEMRVFSALYELFNGEVYSQYSSNKVKAMDLYIVPLNLVVEIDGYPWHLNSKKRDIIKQKNILREGYKLLRFRDNRLPSVYKNTVWDNLTLTNLKSIKNFIQYLKNNYPIPNSFQANFRNINKKKLPGEQHFLEIMSSFPLPKIEGTIVSKSPITKTHPSAVLDWDDNGLLEPHMVSAGMNIEINWKCTNCGNKYKKTVKTRCDQKYGCKLCSDKDKSNRMLKIHKKRRESGVNLGVLFSEIAKEFDEEKNKFSAYEIGPAENRRVWWLCSKYNHSYDLEVSSRTARNDGCPFCSGHRVSNENNLKALFPKIIDIWDYKKNKLYPENYTYGSYQKVYWRCSKCNYTRKGRISDRVDIKKGIIRKIKHVCS